LEAARFLKLRGQEVCLVDQKKLNTMSASFCAKNEIEFCLESQVCVDKFSNLVLSPGIPLSHNLYLKCKDAGYHIYSELDLGLFEYKGKLIGITGTNGKSTVVSMISHILSKNGISNTLAGNIGIPITKIAADGKLEDILVLELSSYQLEHSSLLRADFGGFTSFSSDHLARHKTLESYFSAKWKLFQNSKDGCIFYCSSSFLAAAKKYKHGSVDSLVPATYESLESAEISYESTRIREKHNLENAFIAINCCIKAAGLSLTDCKNALISFAGLPHRLERLEDLGKTSDKIFINDSKATNIESTMTALESQTSPICLLLGGEGKGESFTDLANFAESIEKIVAFGSSGEQIAKELSKDFEVKVYKNLAEVLRDLENVVKSTNGDILLSPGCASFDEFKNFEERGDFFKDRVIEFFNSGKMN